MRYIVIVKEAVSLELSGIHFIYTKAYNKGYLQNLISFVLSSVLFLNTKAQN